MDGQAVDPLIARLKDRNNNVRSSIVKTLGQLKDSRVVEPLLARLSDKDSWVRESASRALIDVGDKAVEPLLEQLNNQYLRQEIVAILGELGDRRALEPLVRQLSDADIRVRWNAATALAKLGDNRATATLLEGLSDGDNVMRWSAEEALAQLGDNRAVKPLLKRLNEQVDWQNRAPIGEAVDGLGRLRDPRTLEPFLALLSYRSVVNNYDRTVKITRALKQLSDRQSIALLLYLLNNQKADTVAGPFTVAEARANAAEVLGQLGDSQVMEPLLARLVDKYEVTEVRSRAATALGHLGNHRALEILLAQMNDYNQDVRFAALLAAAKLGGDKTRDEVTAVFFNPMEKPKLRLAAAVALLAFRQEDGWDMLQTFAKSKRVSERIQVAQVLGSLPVASGTDLLRKLLQDDSLEVRLSAIQSLGNPEYRAALPDLHPLLSDNNVRVQQATAEALALIASPDSVVPFETTVSNSEISQPARLAALEGLGKISTENSIQVILRTFQLDTNEPALQMRACNVLGDLKVRQALPVLSERLGQLDSQYRRWRTIRDAERPDFSKEESEQWAKQLTEEQPQTYWAYILGYNMARIDPEKAGIKLLSHDLADVRAGAWTGLSQVGDVNLLKRLHTERQASQEPLFRHAAYRAIDLLLIRLGGSRNPQDLAALEEFYSQVKDEDGVGTRVEWTVNQLKERLP